MATSQNTNGWPTRPLVDCTFDGNISYGIVQPGQHTENGIPIVRVNNFKNGVLDGSDVLRVSESIEENYRRTRLQGGEVLLTLVGSVGQTAIVSGDMAGWNVARAIAVIRPSEEVSAKWLSICLQTPGARHFLDGRANTTVQKTLNLGDVKQVPIPIPPKAVRHRIESIVTSVDDKIDLNRRINQTLETMAQAIFRSWFVDFDPVKAKIVALTEGRDPLRAAMSAISGKPDAELDALPPEQYAQLAATAALFPDEMEEPESGGIPRGWRAKKFGDFIDRISVGKKFDQKTALVEGLVPILDQGKSGIIGFHNESPGARASLEKPIVVFANHTCYMRLITFDFSAIQNVLPFVGKDVDTVWAYYATKDAVKFSEYKGHWPDFVLADAVVPQANLTVHFRKILQPLISQMRILELESEKLAVLRDTLLPKLLSGELSVEALAEQAGIA